MTGDHAESIALLSELVEEERAHGIADSMALRTREYLAEALVEAGRAADAEPVLAAVVHEGTQSMGRRDSGLWVSEWIDSHARALLAMRQADASSACFLEAFQIRRDGLGSRNIETLCSQRGLAMARFAQGETVAAIEMMRQVVAAAESLKRRGNDFYLATHRSCLASMMISTGSLDEAERQLHLAIPVLEGAGGSKSARFQSAQQMLQSIADLRAGIPAPQKDA
ncbi:MAG: tetratricopeptide repeat protein [Phycisphaerae bacterium]|nr:tetratricopeptide repeat protein [Phycisphaerae bacterium]